MWRVAANDPGSRIIEVHVEETEEGTHHWVLVAREAGESRRVAVSIHQFMTAEGAWEEGAKALRGWDRSLP